MAVYTPEGKSYIIQCDSDGNMFLIEGVSGRIVDHTYLIQAFHRQGEHAHRGLAKLGFALATGFDKVFKDSVTTRSHIPTVPSR